MIIDPATGKPYPEGYLRDYAKGKPCLVRIARSCGYQCAPWDTTVLAHLTMSGLKGVSLKLNDLLGAWACFTCHALLDGGVKSKTDVTHANLVQWHYDGMARTIDQLEADGILAHSPKQIKYMGYDDDRPF